MPSRSHFLHWYSRSSGYPERFFFDLDCADFSAILVKYAFRAASARRTRSAGASWLSGSTCRSNLCMNAALAGVVIVLVSYLLAVVNPPKRLRNMRC